MTNVYNKPTILKYCNYSASNETPTIFLGIKRVHKRFRTIHYNSFKKCLKYVIPIKMHVIFLLFLAPSRIITDPNQTAT